MGIKGDNMKIEYKKMEEFVNELIKDLKCVDGWSCEVEKRWMERIVGMIIGIGGYEMDENFEFSVDKLESEFEKERKREENDYNRLEYVRIENLICEMKKYL